ncbi:Piso0_003214 [Millerozyma farinosa CBS 7064]|uniref:Piso0_003214 protein n=1 Tax=Pichia sorbitophila (strain ATCC MYA-4447 / BCRC 22081 / CBS 7064 / NBRC 10061 / NRRL Y-12695) TaxID=559304 RepID=G8YHH9_PICSO|nr:Piso0_003214 [Millerozyma farinosa CBS 7064]CCE80881.1 Piso0_003214 [Millerozyma farinosa CBS 7064]
MGFLDRRRSIFRRSKVAEDSSSGRSEGSSVFETAPTSNTNSTYIEDVDSECQPESKLGHGAQEQPPSAARPEEGSRASRQDRRTTDSSPSSPTRVTITKETAAATGSPQRGSSLRRRVSTYLARGNKSDGASAEVQDARQNNVERDQHKSTNDPSRSSQAQEKGTREDTKGEKTLTRRSSLKNIVRTKSKRGSPTRSSHQVSQSNRDKENEYHKHHKHKSEQEKPSRSDREKQQTKSAKGKKIDKAPKEQLVSATLPKHPKHSVDRPSVRRTSCYSIYSSPVPKDAKPQVMKIKIFIAFGESIGDLAALRVNKDQLSTVNEFIYAVSHKVSTRYPQIDTSKLQLLLFFNDRGIKPIPLTTSRSSTASSKLSDDFDINGLVLEYLKSKSKVYVKASLK